MSFKDSKVLCANLEGLIKKILMSFCEVNVQYQHKLELFGSVHIRADGDNVFGILLNEKSKKKKDGTKCAGDFSGSPVKRLKSSAEKLSCSSQRSPSGKEHPTSEVVYLSDSEDKSQNSSTTDVVSSSCQLPNNVKPTTRADEVSQKPQEYHHQPNYLTSDNPSATLFSNSGIQHQLSENFLQNTGTSNGSFDNNFLESSEDMVSPKQEPVSCINGSSSNSDIYNEKSTPPFNRINVSGVGQMNSTVLPISENQLSMSGESFKAADKICSFCLKAFKSSISLKLHEETWHSVLTAALPKCNKPLGCGNCRITFNTFEQFSKHECHGKSNNFIAQSMQAQHTKIDSPRHSVKDGSPRKGSAFKCSMCASVLATRDGLKCHINSRHSHNRAWTCNLCTSKTFFSRQALHNHKRTTHKFKGNI